TIVPSPTYAPTFTNIGGIHTTPRPRYAPSRTLDPPGTTRTPSAIETLRTGYVDLSKNGCRLGSIDISTTAPMRKPNRIPCFTHPFTRQPVAVELSGSAARISPRFNAILNVLKI